ncbi:hypothetical protein E3O06_02440 [Cryobacterium glaciale]|uniref:HNH endonuclease n=1 Tax=Cryobacterium glaciale TaxID=1259145 RepID=A0A4R8V586_9MICO|nr:hypothetical protein E3O06_02440 [Cryobacterium glaciale]
MLDQLDSVPPPARAELETVLLPHAKRLTPAQFDGKARKLRERFHPDSITVRRPKCLADRRVQFFPDTDGMATIWLRAAGDEFPAHPHPPAHRHRPRRQRRALPGAGEPEEVPAPPRWNLPVPRLQPLRRPQRPRPHLDKQFGGPTTATNLHFLSPAHHNLKHFSDWKAVATPDGTLHWTSPAGKHYATDPATRISPPRQQTAPAPPPPTAPTPPQSDPWTSVWDTDNAGDPDPQPF